MTGGTYTAEEIAKYLRVHPYTVKRLARAGKVPGFKVGEQWRFDKEEIDGWRKSQGNHVLAARSPSPRPKINRLTKNIKNG